MNKIDRIILDKLSWRFTGGTYYYRLNRLKNAIAKYLPDDLMVAEDEPTIGIWSDDSPMSLTIFPSFYENIRNMTGSDIHEQNKISIVDFGSEEELSFRSYDDEDYSLKFEYTDKGIKEIAELATKILLDPDLERGTFTRKSPKIRLDPKDRKPVKSPFKPVVGKDVVHEKLDGLEIQEYVMETIPTKQLKKKKIGYIGQNITGIIPFLSKIGASRYNIGDDVDILLVGELVGSNLQRILGLKKVHVIRIFDQPDMDLARSTDYFYYDWADDHYRMNRKDVTLDRYVKKQKPDMSKINEFLDRMVEPQRESVFFEPEVSVYRIDGDREIKLDDFDEYLTVIKKLPVTLAFIYQSPIGMYITVSTYIKGSIPSKRRQEAMKDSLRQISARLDEKLSFLDDDVVAIQNAITVLNKSKKTIRTPYSRTIKAKTDSYPVEVLGQHGASFVEEVAPYLDPKRVFNEK